MASFHHQIKSGKKGSAAEHAAYTSRQGKHEKRGDLVATGYGNMPPWAKDNPGLFWKEGDKHERSNGSVYREYEIALPSELTTDQQLKLVDDLVRELIGQKPFQFAVHAPESSLEGEINAHLHLMFSDRVPDGIDRSPEQTFRRYNAKHPEQGGRRKESGGKNRMEIRDEVIAIKKKSAELQNAALAKYGHDARVDHRSLRQQGINRKPELHLGQARIRNMSAEDRNRYVSTRYNQRTADSNQR